jgi:uncharacterized protein YgfB (UPF0149 family)
MDSRVAYDDVARALVARGSTVHPAEAHGCLCGGLCARRDYSGAEWLEEVLPDAGTDRSDDTVLAALLTETSGALARAELEFQPLLPGDAAIAERVEALAAWCQGFLYGIGSAGTTGRGDLPGDVSEVLTDLAGIAQAGAPGTDSPDDEEDAYVELVEFLRAGVQLVYEDLGTLRAAQSVSRSGH